MDEEKEKNEICEREKEELVRFVILVVKMLFNFYFCHQNSKKNN